MSISRRDFIRNAIATAAILAAAPLIPAAPRFVPLSGMALSHFSETDEDFGGWSEFEWDDEPMGLLNMIDDDTYANDAFIVNASFRSTVEYYAGGCQPRGSFASFDAIARAL